MSIAKLHNCPEREKYVCILMDEMHIKADLVYDKHSGMCTVVDSYSCVVFFN